MFWPEKACDTEPKLWTPLQKNDKFFFKAASKGRRRKRCRAPFGIRIRNHQTPVYCDSPYSMNVIGVLKIRQP